jgi:hypothetical protein
MSGWVEGISSLPNTPPTRVVGFGVRGRLRASGLDGDRYFAGAGTWSDYPAPGGKDLTLIEAEVLDGIYLCPARTRGATSSPAGISFNEFVGRRFRVGDVECYGDRLCEPCIHLEQLIGITVSALAYRGGLRADILNDGDIRIGDPVLVEESFIDVYSETV